MTEFLTIRNFVPKTPMNTGETIWYFVILILMVVIALYWLADFIRVINEKFFTVKEWQLDMIDEEVRNGRIEQDKALHHGKYSVVRMRQEFGGKEG